MPAATSMAIATLAVTALAAAASAYGQIQQGKAAKAQGKYQATVMRNNQILAQRAAEDARLRGEQAARQQRAKTAQLVGRQRAALAGAGIEVDEGTALDITSETKGIGELDALTIRSNAEREALGFEAQGSNFEANARLATLQGQNAASASQSAAFGTLLSGAGSVASKWYGFSQQGVFNPREPLSGTGSGNVGGGWFS